MSSFRISGVLALLFLAGCASGPEPIVYGVQECAHCRMTISDARFASRLLTSQGRTFAFDAVECMASYERTNTVEAGNIAGRWVNAYLDSGTMVSADEAHFLISENLPSPMGGNLTAYASATDAARQQQIHQGRVLTWKELMQLHAENGHSRH